MKKLKCQTNNKVYESDGIKLYNIGFAHSDFGTQHFHVFYSINSEKALQFEPGKNYFVEHIFKELE